MQKCKITKMLILFAVFYLINSPLSYSQARKPTVMIKLDRENEYADKTRTFTNLYTIINGRQYFIDRLERVALMPPDPLGVDPTGSYVFYTSNTRCGYEQEGMTIFVSDVYGKKKGPILGRCLVLGADRFLSFQGKNYLQISEGNSGTTEGTGFWLYDVSRREFVMHVEGEISEIKKGVFSYGYYISDAEFKELGNITMATLIRGGKPLRLLPRHPTQGITQKREIRVYPL